MYAWLRDLLLVEYRVQQQQRLVSELHQWHSEQQQQEQRQLCPLYSQIDKHTHTDDHSRRCISGIL